MSLFIGIEGVGLKHSVGVAADRNGQIIASTRLVGQPISLHTTERHILHSRLKNLLKALSEQVGRNLDNLADAVICIGLTGVTFPHDAEIDLPNEFGQLNIKIKKLICTGDIEIAFASHAQTNQGSGIICHMGSTAYVTTPTIRVRYGGWGPVLGDEGSGFWIGHAILRAIAEEYDSGRPTSPLWHKMDEWLQNPEKEYIPDWIGASFLWRRIRHEYCESDRIYDPRTSIFRFSHAMELQKDWQWRAVLSSLTIPLQKLWEAGDTVATQIWNSAANHLAHQYASALKRIDRKSELGPLVLYGGVLTHNKKFRNLLIKKLSNKRILPRNILFPGTPGTMRPACGALLFAIGNSDTRNLRLPSRHLINLIANVQSDLHVKGNLRND
ncbi:BadF/BadG/BcrA/BcrD ATPase family protein [Acidobacteriota bacterium]